MRTHTNRPRPVTSWIAWHATELAALTVPAVLAVTVTHWAWLLVLAAAAAWVAHETHQQRRSHRARRDHPAPTSTATAPELTPADSADTHSQEASHG